MSVPNTTCYANPEELRRAIDEGTAKLTHREIGRLLNISATRVRHIEQRALYKLYQRLADFVKNNYPDIVVHVLPEWDKVSSKSRGRSKR